MKMKILLILLLSVSVKLFAVASDGTKNFLGWSGDGTNTLTTTDFKLTGYDASGNFNMLLGGSIAYGGNGLTGTCVYKLSVDGTNTGSFQLSGISANEFDSDADYTNVYLVGNTIASTTVQSENTITGTGVGVAKESYTTATLGLANFSGVDLESIELRFDIEAGATHLCGNIDFNSFTIVNAKAPVTTKPEPTNYPTSFVATANSTSQITTAWTDSVTGSQAPDGYLVMCSTSTFNVPVDGTAQSDDTDCSDGSGVQNIAHGVGTVAWTGLSAGTQYYYAIVPYTNSGVDINYKTDGVVPTANATTLSPNNVPNTTLPATPTVKEDDINALLAGISIADGDTDGQTVTLSVTNGTVSLNSITGLSITTGDGIDDSSMIFNGTLANVNSALNNLKFSPTADFDGTATIQVQTNDGNGGTDDDTLNITVNNAPEVSSITRVGSSPTNATSVDFTVTFSESVSNVDTADFELTTTGTASGTIASVSGASGTTITVTVNSISGDGTLKLNLKDDDTITNTNNVALGGTGITSSGNGSYTSGESYTIDTVAPTVTDVNIAISGASGTSGAYIVGDTVTATWNNTAGGDNNGDISTVTFDFSAFGGGSTVSASNSGDTWTATYTIVAGTIDASNLNVSVTATDTSSNSAITADTTNATVDSIAPTLSTLSPADDVTNAFASANLVMTMSENIAKGTGNIVIKKSIGDIEIESVPVGDSRVSISGSVVTINLTSTLELNVGYYVIVPSTALVDIAGNAYAGFSTSTDWNFTTVDNQAPLIDTNFINLSLNEDNGTSSYDINISDGEFNDLNLTVESNNTAILRVTQNWTNLLAKNDYNDTTLRFDLTTQANANGKVKITITVDDGDKNSTKTFDINVTAVNDAPVINTIFNDLSIAENNGTTLYDINISDIELSDLNLTIESNNTSILTVTPNWSGELNSSNWIKDFNLTTVENANGKVKITIRTTDGDVNVTKTFDVIVTAVDYAPVLEAITDINKNEDDSSFTVELNATDSDGDAISYSVSSSDETIVTVSEDNGILTIVPITNANGIATIEVNATANDKSDIVSFDINITAVNDTPSIDTNFANISLDEDNGTSSYDINISDIERSDLNLTVESNNTAILMVTPSWSELISEANYQTNNFNLTTVAHANGKVKITITVNDGELSSTKTFDVTVRAVNDAPTINTLFNDMSIVENNGSSSYDINISDIELSDLTLTIESNDTSILTVTPNWSGALDSSNWINSFNLTTVANANGVVRITITVDDGELNTKKTFDVNVTAIDYAPILDAIADINKIEDDSSFDVTLNASDSDGDTISYEATSSNALIATVIENSGVLTITPLANQYGVVTIEVVASANNKSDTKSFKVNIASVNDAPTITINENITIDENQEQILSFSYTDVDGDNIAVTTTKEPQNGTVTRTDSTITYTPYGDFSGSDHFILSFDDGNGGTVDKTIVVVVNPINSEVNITVASITKLFSNLKDTNVTVDKESGETTIIADSNVTTEIGFVYRAIVVIDKSGKTNTKIVRVNLATQEETLIDFTLQNGIWYKEGNNIKISIKNGMLQIKITTKINTPLIIN